jgi:hypothetical protein
VLVDDRVDDLVDHADVTLEIAELVPDVGQIAI